ncbi:MAG: hypothetical protein WCO52_01675 [bacterium]
MKVKTTSSNLDPQRIVKDAGQVLDEMVSGLLDELEIPQNDRERFISDLKRMINISFDEYFDQLGS